MSAIENHVNDDPRIGEQVQVICQENNNNNNKYDIALLGFPHDEGVKRNGGRVGAKNGPDAVRKLMKRVGTVINPELNIDVSNVKLGDFGNVHQGLELEDAHKQLSHKVFSILEKFDAIPFVIGGGNDQSYPNAMGLINHLKKSGKDSSKLGVINIDAHFDVRPLKDGKEHSGSPFRLLLETPGFNSKYFVEFASQGTQCSAEHANYITKTHQGSIFWLSQVKKQGVVTEFKKILDSFPENVFVSFDIDAIQSSDCPGVSAPGIVGISAEEALAICFEAGKCSKVKLVDVSEYNPKIEEYRTGKLVASMFAHFVMGYSQRSASC